MYLLSQKWKEAKADPQLSTLKKLVEGAAVVRPLS